MNESRLHEMIPSRIADSVRAFTEGGRVDLLLINPGGREIIYQDLGAEVSAVEPPLWCRLIAGYVADRGYSVQILDAEAESLAPADVATIASVVKPGLIAIVV